LASTGQGPGASPNYRAGLVKAPASSLGALITKQRAAVAAAAAAADKAEGKRLAKAADTLTKHLTRWVPDDIPDAVRLLQWGGARPPPQLIKSVVAGLRAIAAHDPDHAIFGGPPRQAAIAMKGAVASGEIRMTAGLVRGDPVIE